MNSGVKLSKMRFRGVSYHMIIIMVQARAMGEAQRRH